MYKIKSHLVFVCALFVSAVLSGQDIRTLETRVADLLARLPADNKEMTSRLMDEMYSLGDEGTAMICSMIVPAGTGDDARARYAVWSLTNHLTASADKEKKTVWESQCIRFMKAASSSEVCSFFMSQLGRIGGDASVGALSSWVNDSLLCSNSVMALESIGTDNAREILASALGNNECPCASQIMVSLGEANYSGAVDKYIDWYNKGTQSEKSAALFAMASCIDIKAMPVLLAAAEKAQYKWDPLGAVQALLLYSRNAGLAGDLKTMQKITGLVLAKSNTQSTSNQRLAALSIQTTVLGNGAVPALLKATGDPDADVRAGILRLVASMPGEDITKKWISKYNKVSQEIKPELVYMFGERGDRLALSLISKALYDPSPEISEEAVTALAKIEGRDAVDPLLTWIVRTGSEEGHWVAANALMTVLDGAGLEKVASALPSSKGHASVTLIYLLAWSGDKKYFSKILGCYNTDDIGVRASALTALKKVASFEDQETIISLLSSTEQRPEINELQSALAAAALRGGEHSDRTAAVIAALNKGGQPGKLIPVLSLLGGEKAASCVIKYFNNGDAETREVCFDALAHWCDVTALPALYDICASGNKTYERAAMDASLRQISSSDLTPERKILHLKKIAPLAVAPDLRADMLTIAGSLNIYPAVFFVSRYINDPDEQVALAAKEAVINSDLPDTDEYFTLFNGKDLSGWQGLVGNPVTRTSMKPAELAARQKEADKKMTENWRVKDGNIVFNGAGDNLCTVKEYGDFEMFVDWRITKKGDSGIYLRGTPQVQIWDTSRTDVGAQVGSGGLYNNIINRSTPLMVADNPVGEWNTFRIIMNGDKVSVWLNGETVTDNVVMENYWDRSLPLFEKGPVELQAHGTDLAFRDIMLREIRPTEYNLTPEEKAHGFVSLFNGRDLTGWVGNKTSYGAEDGMIVIRPGDDSGGNLYTEKEYDNFVFRFEFQLTPGANNGLGIRAPLTGDAAYVGMELQILDNTAAIYANLHPWQYHGSVYGVIPAVRGFLKPVGEWNSEEVIVDGTNVKVILNGTVIVDGDIAMASANGTIDGKEHPGLKNNTGHIGFLGHGSLVKFRNIRIREL